MTPGHERVPEFYRRNVGLMLIAADRRIFVGRRVKQPDAWQMPQGGIDDGEAAVEAACRELWEEVGTTRALLLRESAKWLTYDVPEALRPDHWKGRWQRPGAEMVRARLHRPRRRHRYRRARP